MSNSLERSFYACARAAKWLLFLLLSTQLSGVSSWAQTVGLPAPLTGDCSTNSVGSLVCTGTNGASFGSPASYAGGFAASQNHLWLLTEGTGNTAKDWFGSANAISAGTFTWTADGGLSFSGGYANRAIAKNATSALTFEVVMMSSMPLGTQSIMPIAYGGAPAASSSQVQIGAVLHSNWQGVIYGSSNEATLPAYAGHYLSYTSFQAANASTDSRAVQGVHVIDLEGGPNQPWTVYVDGVAVSDQSGGDADLNPTTLVNGFTEFGGSPLGYAQCDPTFCGFSGTIYGAATYSTRLTPTQIQQNAANWLHNVLPAKGVNVLQTSRVNNGNGAQGNAGKAVNLVSIGESITWGHGLSSPGQQNYSVVAAGLINGGNAYGLGFGYDSRSEYVIHRSLGPLEAMYSPTATNVAVLFSNSNDCRYSANGSTSGIETYSSNVADQSARDEITDALELRSKGWVVLLGTGLSGTPLFGTGDASKDTCNPVLRRRAAAADIPLWDIANEPRVGADGAYNASSGTGCNGSACYQSDNLHPSQAAQAIMGANLAMRVNSLLYSAPKSVTAASYVMDGTEAPLTVNPSGASQTITLPDCIGFTGTSFNILNTQATGANVVTIVPAQSGETMNGVSAFTLPNAATATFKALAGPDVVAGCSWQVK